MRPDTADDQCTGIVAAGDVTNFVLADLRTGAIEYGYREIALIVVVVDGECRLPFVGASIRAEIPIPVLEFETLLSVQIPAQSYAEHPVVPGIADLACDSRRGRVVRNLQTVCEWRMSSEPHQAESQHAGKAAPNVVLGVGSLGVPAQRVGGVRVTLESDERQREFLPAGRVLCRYKNVHLCIGSIAARRQGRAECRPRCRKPFGAALP